MGRQQAVLEKKLTFNVATCGGERFAFSAYSLMRLACYPIAAKQGDRKSYVGSFQVSVDGALRGHLEQDQWGVTDVAACDLNLVKYFLHTQYEDGEDQEALQELHLYNRDVRIHEVEVLIKFWEKK